MKPLFAFLLAIFIALPAYAHPGKTDRHGGHQCIKECAEWDLFYREYHTHDKNGRPVRVARNKQMKPAAGGVPVDAAAVVNAAPAAAPAQQPASVLPLETEASMLPWVLLALFLLLLLIVRRKSRKSEGNDMPL